MTEATWPHGKWGRRVCFPLIKSQAAHRGRGGPEVRFWGEDLTRGRCLEKQQFLPGLIRGYVLTVGVQQMAVTRFSGCLPDTDSLSWVSTWGKSENQSKLTFTCQSVLLVSRNTWCRLAGGQPGGSKRVEWMNLALQLELKIRKMQSKAKLHVTGQR